MKPLQQDGTPFQTHLSEAVPTFAQLPKSLLHLREYICALPLSSPVNEPSQNISHFYTCTLITMREFC